MPLCGLIVLSSILECPHCLGEAGLDLYVLVVVCILATCSELI